MASGTIDMGYYQSGDSIYLPSAGGVFCGFRISDTVIRMMVPLCKPVSSGITATCWGTFTVRCGLNVAGVSVPNTAPLAGTITGSGIVFDLTDGTTTFGTDLICAVGVNSVLINFN